MKCVRARVAIAETREPKKNSTALCFALVPVCPFASPPAVWTEPRQRAAFPHTATPTRAKPARLPTARLFGGKVTKPIYRVGLLLPLHASLNPLFPHRFRHLPPHHGPRHRRGRAPPLGGGQGTRRSDRRRRGDGLCLHLFSTNLHHLHPSCRPSSTSPPTSPRAPCAPPGPTWAPCWTAAATR